MGEEKGRKVAAGVHVSENVHVCERVRVCAHWASGWCDQKDLGRGIVACEWLSSPESSTGSGSCLCPHRGEPS